MNMEVSRRQFMRGAAAGVAGTTLGALGFGEIADSLRQFDSRLEASGHHGNPQHLHILCGGLRHHHVLKR